MKILLLFGLLGLAESCIPTFNPDFNDELLTTTQKACPTGWLLFMDNCYLLVEKYAVEGDAEAACVAQGAHLTSIHSQAENDFIASLTDDFVWFGLTTPFTTWTDGTAVDFNAFYPGYGNNNGMAGNDCGYLENTIEVDQRGWYSSPCDFKSSYVCKKPL